MAALGGWKDEGSGPKWKLQPWALVNEPPSRIWWFPLAVNAIVSSTPVIRWERSSKVDAEGHRALVFCSASRGPANERWPFTFICFLVISRLQCIAVNMHLSFKERTVTECPGLAKPWLYDPSDVWLWIILLNTYLWLHFQCAKWWK